MWGGPKNYTGNPNTIPDYPVEIDLRTRIVQTATPKKSTPALATHTRQGNNMGIMGQVPASIPAQMNKNRIRMRTDSEKKKVKSKSSN